MDVKYLAVALNSRERTAAPVCLYIGNGLSGDGKTSSGIDGDAWQGAYVASKASRDVFSAEMAVPWAALAAAGLRKEQLLINVQLCDATLNGPCTGCRLAPKFHLEQWARYFSPMYLGAARGPAAEATPHTVRLYFAEMEGKTNGQRVFDVGLQGQKVLTDFDVVAAAGGGRREVVKEFHGISIEDKLDIGFTRKTGEPMLSGVEIIGADADQTGVLPEKAIRP